MEVEPSLTETSIQAPIGSALLEADSQIIQRPGWYQIVTPSIKEPSANEVILSRIADGEAQSRVDETFDLYRKFELPFKWCIGPMSNRRAIEPKIENQASSSWAYRGMAVSCETKVSHPENVSVARVDDLNMEAFLDVFLQGWDMEHLRDKTRTKLLGICSAESAHPYFLATIDGKPVGAAGTVLKSDYGYLVGAIVLKDFRGSGAYRALLQARLKDLKNRGSAFAITHAREATSAPILEKLGFQTTFNAKIYKFD